MVTKCEGVQNIALRIERPLCAAGFKPAKEEQNKPPVCGRTYTRVQFITSSHAKRRLLIRSEKWYRQSQALMLQRHDVLALFISTRNVMSATAITSEFFLMAKASSSTCPVPKA